MVIQLSFRRDDIALAGMLSKWLTQRSDISNPVLKEASLPEKYLVFEFTDILTLYEAAYYGKLIPFLNHCILRRSFIAIFPFCLNDHENLKT